MGAIIEFPQNQNDRVKKISESKKRKRTTTSPEIVPKPTPIKQSQTTSLHLSGLVELTKTLDDTNDICKCVTDCLYDLSWSLNRFKLVVMLATVIMGTSFGAVFLTLILRK